MSEVKVRVRGIYSTALSFLLSQKFQIVDPSEVIQARLGLPPSPGPAEVNIFDRPDRHGVVIEGVRSGVEEVVQFLRENIPWVLFLPKEVQAKGSSPFAAAFAALLSRYEGEFPRPAKEFLDEVRAKVVPTLPGHHLLKTVDPTRVDEAEQKFPSEEFGSMAQKIWEELVGPYYQLGKTVTVWHLKAGEPPIRQVGEVLECTKEILVLRRNFGAGGIYDGLGLHKEAGDYGFFELPIHAWWGRRRYFRADGTFLGEIYNIHTPPELLPDGVRYLDLELDVVNVAGDVHLVDAEVLEKKVAEGLLSRGLAEKAREIAEDLVQKLKAGAAPS